MSTADAKTSVLDPVVAGALNLEAAMMHLELLGFSLEGELLDWVDTGLPEGALMGIDFDRAGRIYVVDANANRILRMAAD